MIKQIILLAIFGLASCNPINSVKLNYENDLMRISERFDQKSLPSISGLDANTLVEIVDMFPGDWTLNELIIVGAQTIFGEILDMQPVPDWFDDFAQLTIQVIYKLSDEGTGQIYLDDLRPFLKLADQEFPGMIPVEFINYDQNIDLNSALLQTTDVIVEHLKSVGYNANELNQLVSEWHKVLSILNTRGTDAVKFEMIRPLLKAALKFVF